MVGRRKGASAVTNLEMQVMQVLWKNGACTVTKVQQHLKPGKSLAYTTVQTVLNTLDRKKKVRRILAGRAYCYEAITSRENVLKHAIRELAERIFGGSSEDLVMSLIKMHHADPEWIAGLSRKVAAEESPDE